ncbi:MAG TPA: S8 family serine peptidase, partial [bacterium]|nr:S8 family serine peptidase [bacterium]
GFVEFPANVNGVIAVGATDKSNNILYYSPRSKLSQKDSIDVVCPTGQLPSLVLLYNCDNKFIA